MLAATTWKACLTSRFRWSKTVPPLLGNTDKAGEELVEGALTGNLTIANGGGGYNGNVAGTLTGVELISNMGGRGAEATVEINGSGGAVTSSHYHAKVAPRTIALATCWQCHLTTVAALTQSCKSLARA